jgi:hypothetical protein
MCCDRIQTPTEDHDLDYQINMGKKMTEAEARME